MGIHWFTKRRIIYFLVFGVLWLLWQLFTDELAGIIRGHIPEGGIVMYGITHPYVIMPILLILSCLLLLWWSFRKQGKQAREQPSTPPSENLTDILTLMHRRLVELQKEKAARTKIRYGQWEKVMPTLADRMGTVKLKDWPKFEKSIKRRVKRAIPRRNFRRRFNFLEFVKFREKAHLAALSVASEIKEELFQSKGWTLEDGVKTSEWLDDYHWGVKELRDNDPQWDTLFKSIDHYLKDEILRKLIKKHIDFSYVYNNVSLACYYSNKYPKDAFSLMLHETLVGSPISPLKAEIALGEILSEIEKRLAEIQGGKQKKESSIKQVVEELLTVVIYTNMPVNIIRILYHDREKLAVGLSNEVASEQDKLVLSQLNLRKIVKLEQRKVRIYGSDNTRDEGYWILTELGKEVIKYLQGNKQVLDKEGSLSE